MGRHTLSRAYDVLKIPYDPSPPHIHNTVKFLKTRFREIVVNPIVFSENALNQRKIIIMTVNIIEQLSLIDNELRSALIVIYKLLLINPSL